MQDESFLKSRIQKIYQFLEPPLLTLGRFLTFIVRKLFSHVLKNFFTPSGIWSISILFLFFLFFIFDDFRNKYSHWFFDNIGKVTGKSSTSGGVHIQGDVDATVSRPFKDAIQACWYYHANYVNSHPYTILWNKPDEEGNYPKIRVIADPAYWQAEKCIKENGQVKLIGIEYTKHAIHAQSGINENFIQIATSEAYYRSALFFDRNGRITERKVLSNKDRKESNFEYISSAFLCDLIKDATDRRNVECLNPEKGKENTSESLEERSNSNENKKYTFIDLKQRPDNFNILQIVELYPGDSEGYSQAIIRYIKERENLHTELVKKGCGAISIEPELAEANGELIQTSIAFLCLKESGPHSHVRLMHRVSESSF